MGARVIAPVCEEEQIANRLVYYRSASVVQQIATNTNSLLTETLVWPALADLRMGAAEADARLSGVGGSDANVIFSGDRDKIRQLWSQKRGTSGPADLSDKLNVMLGCWTEAFNRQWYEKLTGETVVDPGSVAVCTEHWWRRCTLDGLVQSSGAVFEAKHSSAFVKVDELLERYMPQLQHNMAVSKTDRAVLSVILGNNKFEIVEVAADWLYQLELLQAEEEFWNCVVAGKEPVAADAPAPPKPIGIREVCLEGNNLWATAALDWIENRDAAKRHSAACVTIKELVEDDVSRAFGHGIEAKRSRSGAITIREFAI